MTRGSDQSQIMRRLGVTIAGVAFLATPGLAQAPESVSLSGIVRDFRPGYPDFVLSPSFVYPHSAGNLALSLDSAGKPMYAGGGYLVAAEWMNDGSMPIAPHLFGVTNAPQGGGGSAGGQVLLALDPSYKNNPVMDTYDPALGPYGGANVGPAPEVVVGASMPSMPLPPDLGVSLGDMTFSGNGSSTIDASFECDMFRVRNRHTVMVSGHVTIVANDGFSIENNADLVILEDSSLTVFNMGPGSIENHVNVNYNTADHTALTIYHMSSQDFAIGNHTHMYASVMAPNGKFTMRNNSEFCGAVAANDMNLEHPAQLHIAGGAAAAPAEPCFEPQDLEGAAGNPTSGLISGDALFAQWFRTVPGENLAINHTIEMPADENGVYTYSVFDFTPINAQGYGNDWGFRNRAFTFEGFAMFTGESCAGHFLEWEGAGDVWVFIDGEMVLDMGGAPKTGRQIIEVDRLGLTPGVDHTLKVFYAQRVHTIAPFTLRTNIPLRSDSMAMPSASALTD